MRVVALEEHFTVPALASKYVKQEAVAKRGHFKGRNVAPGKASPMELLPEIGEKRFKSMDDAGITVQVLSNSGVGADLVPGPDGITLAKGVNDYLAEVVTKHPKRFAGFASLPMATPDGCADELRRAVKDLKMVGAMIHGTTEGRFLDHPSYDGLLAAAVELDVPIYIHPHIPPEPVRRAYFSDLPPGASRVLETSGWGWHSETAVHLLRMIVAGRLDRHPRLKLIIGHMGEMVPMMLDRADQVFRHDIGHLKRSVADT